MYNAKSSAGTDAESEKKNRKPRRAAWLSDISSEKEPLKDESPKEGFLGEESAKDEFPGKESPRDQTAAGAFAEGESVPQSVGEDDYVILGGGSEEPIVNPVGLQESYQYFDIKSIWKSLATTPLKEEKAERLIRNRKIRMESYEEGYTQSSSELVGNVLFTGAEGISEFPVRIVFGRKQVTYTECHCRECNRLWYSPRKDCGYVTAALKITLQYVEEHKPGDATDEAGADFLYAFASSRANRIMSDTFGERESLTLKPRLVQKDGKLSLSFKVGEGKLFVIKDLSKFYSNVLRSATDTYGSSTVINHGLSHFRKEDRRWIDFIGSIVQEEKEFETRLQTSGAYYTSKAVAPKGALEMFGWRLDRLFEMVEQEELDWDDRDGAEKAKYPIGFRRENPRVSVTVSPNLDGNVFHGVKVICHVPKLYFGNGTAYHRRDRFLCRAEDDFMDKIRPILNCAGEYGSLFRVGRNHLAEFYYTALPVLQDVAEVAILQPDLIARYLPPQVSFVFYLDAVDHNLICKAHARYPEGEFSVTEILGEEPIESFRQMRTEEEILFRVRQWFPEEDKEQKEFHCGQDEDRIYEFLEKGVGELLSLGEVQCTQRFRNLNMAKTVKLSVGVSVSDGLLNLELGTEDLSREELLEVLKSYRARKKYHRLRNGDYLSMEDDTLEMLYDMMETLRLSPREFIRGKMHLPLYRALYLDALLEEHEGVYANRDSHFKELAKGFKTVKDADFTEPPTLERVLRGYQKAGYQWLRTLEAYGFGGILADDMGLGKTLQVIAVLLAARLEGHRTPSIVICPASLVFNWGEEIRRFAPELSFLLVVGTQEERRHKLANYQDYDVLITSYDLLKRDIPYYEDKEFHYQIIDEAQYIKNHATAAAKAVKVVHSKTRYALTGTPIENRLSELWSIFDYLLPGFLYGYDVFKKNYELPIVKNGDEEAGKRLQKMVAPFILRRLKENVLKDLPDKLEEVRYVRFEEQQQKLYDGQVVHMQQTLERQSGEEFQKNKLQILAELTRLRQICCDPNLCFENYQGESAKLEACMELIVSAAEGGHKMLLFSQFTSMLEIIGGRLKEAGLSYYEITGATPKERRLELVKAFNSDDTKVFLISLKAGGVGLNLIGADVVIHYDPWWNLAVQNQATDRAHRIGQTRKVVVYKLIAKGSVEEKIKALQDTKKDLADQIINGEMTQLSSLSKEEFMELLQG